LTEENTIANSNSSSDRTREFGFGFYWLCIGVGCLWIVCTFAIYWLFDSWQTRGTVGDSFGAVNALFSGLAFAGVIYALNLQRRELKSQREEMLATRRVSEAQLAEMKASRELLGQPLPIPEIEFLQIERPRFFYTPPEAKYSAQSRYIALITLSNPTQYPAIGVNVRCLLQFGEPRKAIGATDSYVSIVAPNAKIDTPLTRPDFLFAGDNGGLLFDSLRQHDPRKVPTLIVIILFKNIVGAHFRLIQAFQIYADDQQSESLRLWHTGIAGFLAKYKQELTALRELRRKGKEDDWDELFERVKKEFADSVLGDDTIDIRAFSMPASFSLEHIPKEEFENEMKVATYSQFIGSLYDCPADLDTRK
jgi:hypothetical protein